MSNVWRALVLSLLVVAGSGTSMAQGYPSRSIKFVIPFGPGSSTDVLVRIVAQDMSKSVGQTIIVVDKPGADGALSALEVKRALPDGYTFLVGTNSPLAVVPSLRKDVPYDVMNDFTPITFMGDNTFYIVVHPSMPVKSIPELVAYAKKNPGKISYASGSTYALVATAMFATHNGMEMNMVPYKSEPESIVDLLSGRVQLLNGTYTTVAPHVKEGRLRMLATTFRERSPLVPDIPCFKEVGQPDFPIGPWFAFLGPAGLPRDIVMRMNKEMSLTLAKDSVREAMLKQGFIPKSSTPEALITYMKDQMQVWKVALKNAGLEAQ